MKTKLAALALSLLVAAGLSGCYTEFATTGDTYGGYGQSGNNNQYYYNDSTNSGYSYDTTGVSSPYSYNNYNSYNYYGSPYGTDMWYYNNWFTPSSAWWNSDNLWLGFGWNSWGNGPYSMYGGLGFGWYNNFYSPYYSYYSPYYSPFGYSPYGYYGYYSPYYYYQTAGTQVPARARNFGNTRNGRQEFGGGSASYGMSGAGSNVSGGNAGARSSVESPGAVSTSRARASSGSATPVNSTTQTGVRSRGSSAPTSGTVNSGSQPQTPQSTPQPPTRVRQQNPPPEQRPPSNPQPQQPPENNPQPQPRQRAPQYNPPPPPPSNPAPSYQPPSYQPPMGPSSMPAPRPRGGGPGRLSYYNRVPVNPAVPRATRFGSSLANFARAITGAVMNYSEPAAREFGGGTPVRSGYLTNERVFSSSQSGARGGHEVSNAHSSGEGGGARARH